MSEGSPQDRDVPFQVKVFCGDAGAPLDGRWRWVVGSNGGGGGSGVAPTAVDALEAVIEHLMGFEFPGGPTLQHTKAQRFRAVMARRHQLVRRLQRREADLLGQGDGGVSPCPECGGSKKDAEGGSGKCRYCGGKGKIRRRPDARFLQSLSTATRTQLSALDGDAKMLGVEKPPPEKDGGRQADEFANWRKRRPAAPEPESTEADASGEE